MPSIYSDYVEDETYPCLPKGATEDVPPDFCTSEHLDPKWTVEKEQAFMKATSAAPHVVMTEADVRSHETFIQRSGSNLNPELPEWFQAPHKSDKYTPKGLERPRPIPAMILIEDDEFEDQFGHPEFSTESSFRFKANTATSFPMFSINVCDGHWRQSDNAVRQHKSVKPRGTGILITEPDSNTYKEGHQEDDLEFHLDIASYFSIETMSQLPGEIKTGMEGVNLSVSSSETRSHVQIQGDVGCAAGSCLRSSH